MIRETLKKHSLEFQDFCKFAGLSQMQVRYSMKKNDPIYMAGLEKKFNEFIEWKIEQLQKAIRIMTILPSLKDEGRINN